MSDSLKYVEIDGIPATVNVRALSSFQYVRAMAKARKGNVEAVSDVLEMTFGAEQLDNISKSLAGDDGFTSAEAVLGFFQKAVDGIGEESGSGDVKN